MYERKKDIKNYISRSIGKKIRKIPEIKFIIDSTEHEASRINKILSDLNTSSKK
jgi:ribosome-binding factor A